MISRPLGQNALDFPAFVRAVGVERNAPHAFLLGAGASISSGVPSASMCVWEWKRAIFLTQNPGLEDQVRELTQPAVRQKIQRWLDAEGVYPPEGANDEYDFYAQACYPIPDNRRQYFQNLVAGTRPALGYQLLCLLAEANVIESVWTPNFDALVPKAAPSFDVAVIEVGLDTSNRIARQPRQGELLHVALHGDFRYDALKNTAEELRKQDETLRLALIRQLAETTLIVVGYSGRDRSIMRTLEEAYSENGVGRLFWCGFENPDPPEAVRRLIEIARSNGRQAYYVPSPGFEEVMERLALHCLPENKQQVAQELRSSAASRSDARSVPFAVQAGPPIGLIKSNTFPIECPSELLQFRWKRISEGAVWRRLRQRTAGKDVIAAPLRGKILAIGTTDGLRDAFSGESDGKIERTPIDGEELGRTNGVVVSLLTEGLTHALSAARNLGSNGRDLLWLKGASEVRRVHDTTCRIHEAVLVFIKKYAENQYLVLKPTIYSTDEIGRRLPVDTEKELKRLILSKQYNKQFNDALNRWRNKLFPDGSCTVEYPINSSSTFRYNIRAAPAFAQITGHRGGSIRIPPGMQRLTSTSGVEVNEPELLFSNQRGDGYVGDVNPVRGLSRNRPYDFPLNIRGLAREIRLGVVCPRRDAGVVANYLANLRRQKKADTKREYLLDFPGFDQAFGTTLIIPDPHNTTWVDCPEPANNASSRARSALELGRQIAKSVEALSASADPDLVVIIVPRRWQHLERFETDDERFDLHDYVKAFCVRRGIPTQFLRENTLKKSNQGEIMWWLALSFYVKAMRTPWVLANMDPELAYLGLGFSLDQSAGKGQQILMGCSHVYNSEGVGLSYRLSQLEHPIISRQGNPFMSREDARRMAENAVQLFFGSSRRIPHRMVVHKRTPFNKEEKQGLLEGLSGVAIVDMLEINVEPALRYVASRISGGKFEGDGFPVRRGTTIVLDGHNALVWVHGTVEAVDHRRRYYQGKSRIPAPLVIRRHYGTSSLSVLAEETLGLSKMDWNTLDMYTKMPTTLRSSNEIARIGGLLDRLGAHSYDYRLFI